jgi:hypothetical protein
MSKVVRVQDGDYKLVVGSENSEGHIIFDTNPQNGSSNQGKVTITGDLEVLGKTTTIESEDLSLKDNIIYLNVGETGTGVSALKGGKSGIQIDRGSLPDVTVLWNETVASRNPQLGVDQLGTFVFSDVSNNLKAIATNSINSFGGNLALISSGTGVVTVSGTADYEARVLNYSKLALEFQISTVSRSLNTAVVTTVTPHGLVVGDLVDVICTSNVTFSGISITVGTVPNGNTFTYNNAGPNIVPGIPGSASGSVRPSPIIDDDIIPNMKAVADYARVAAAFTVSNKIQEQDTRVQVKDLDISGVSEITFDVNGIQRALINSNGLFSGNINIRNNNIVNIATDNILFDSVLNIPNRISTPSTPSGYVKLYSKNTPGTGGTGLYFVNTIGTNDELISKTKALLYSLIL